MSLAHNQYLLLTLSGKSQADGFSCTFLLNLSFPSCSRLVIRDSYYPEIIDGETEAQKGEAACSWFMQMGRCRAGN